RRPPSARRVLGLDRLIRVTQCTAGIPTKNAVSSAAALVIAPEIDRVCASNADVNATTVYGSWSPRNLRPATSTGSGAVYVRRTRTSRAVGSSSAPYRLMAYAPGRN